MTSNSPHEESQLDHTKTFNFTNEGSKFCQIEQVFSPSRTSLKTSKDKNYSVNKDIQFSPTKGSAASIKTSHPRWWAINKTD